MISRIDRSGDACLETLTQAEREVIAAQRTEVGCLALILIVAASEIALLVVAFG